LQKCSRSFRIPDDRPRFTKLHGRDTAIGYTPSHTANDRFYFRKLRHDQFLVKASLGPTARDGSWVSAVALFPLDGRRWFMGKVVQYRVDAAERHQRPCQFRHFTGGYLGGLSCHAIHGSYRTQSDRFATAAC